MGDGEEDGNKDLQRNEKATGERRLESRMRAARWTSNGDNRDRTRGEKTYSLARPGDNTISSSESMISRDLKL